MGKAMNVFVAVMAIAAIFLHTTEADEVYHELIWTIPAGGAGEYATWVAAISLQTDGAFNYDGVVFDFAPGEQNLARVTKEDFDSCNTTNPIWILTEPLTYIPGYAGTVYFTRTFAGHCAKGQKIALTWANSSLAAAPCPSSSPTAHSALPRKFNPKQS